MFNHCYTLHEQTVLLSQGFLSSALAAEVKPHAGKDFKEGISSCLNPAADWWKTRVEPPRLSVCACRCVRWGYNVVFFGMNPVCADT